MSVTPKRRLDEIERQLTPKQWAIKLADDIRQHASQDDFLKAIGSGTYRQSPFVLPFFALSKQARERWPKTDQEGIQRAAELCRNLRMEFHALKMLIDITNSGLEMTTETSRLRAALQLSRLHSLILEDSMARTGTKRSISEISKSLRFYSLLEEWADNSAGLLTKVSAHKTAIEIIQKDYFDGHPILYKDNEAAQEETIQAVRDAIAAFNEFLNARAELSFRPSHIEKREDEIENSLDHERESRLPIDVEGVEARAVTAASILARKRVETAIFRGKAAILREEGKHEQFIWKRFQEEFGSKPQL